MKNPINERINFLFESNNIDASSFCRASGMSKQSLSNIRLRKTSPNAESLRLILNFFKTINARWLITGDGDVNSNESQIPLTDGENKKERLSNCEKLEIENYGLKRENSLLREMVEILKNR